MADMVATLLKMHGPCLTSDLIALMVKDGVSEAAARQRVKRAKGGISKFGGLRFAKNARFIYLDNQYGSTAFWLALEKALATSGKAYWGAIVGLKARGGRCPKSLFPIVCGAPKNRKGQLSPDLILERLTHVRFLEERNDEEGGEPYICIPPYGYRSAAQVNAVLLAEQIALYAVKHWARSLGFGSYDKFLIRNEAEQLPIVSSIAWDLSAPSYFRPLVGMHNGKIKPGFFVCDINLTSVVGIDQVTNFIRKHTNAAAPQNVSPIMPMLVADAFTQEAFDHAKSSSILAVTLENAFGRGFAKALLDLIKLLTDMGNTAAVNPAHLEKVFSRLSRIEGAAGNLRGPLFELTIASLVKEVEGGYVRTGMPLRLPSSQKTTDLDVVLSRENVDEVLVIECKAKLPGSEVSLKDVKKWYSDMVPDIYRAFPRTAADFLDGKEYKFQFEIWTNGTFHPAAKEWLEQQQTVFDNYTVGWRDGADLKRYTDKCRNGAINKILNEHFFRNPLTRLQGQSPAVQSDQDPDSIENGLF